MGQYQIGTVDVTNGSPTVTGFDTEWLANVSVGDGFKLEGYNAVFDVAAVVSDTEITLSTNWPYTSQLAQNYQVHRDFTPNMNLPEIWAGDKDWPYHLTVALRILDGLVETSKKANLSGTAPPGVNDDESAGYDVGSMWIDTTSSPKEVYRCVDATAGAAVWVNTSLEIGELGTIAVQDANAVDIDGGSIDGTDIGQTTPADGTFNLLVSPSVVLYGGVINDVSIGGSTPASGKFTVLEADDPLFDNHVGNRGYNDARYALSPHDHGAVGGVQVDHEDLANKGVTTHAAIDTQLGLEFAHRTGNGSDHANVALNDAHRAGDGSDHANVALSDTHRLGDGSDHANVALADTHRTGNGSDHANVALNDTHRATVTGNPHAVTKAEVGLGNVTDDAQLKREAGDINTFTEKTSPVMQDVILIEDADDANNKKRIQLGNIPSTGASSEADIYQDVLGSTKYQACTYDDFNDEALVDGVNTTATYNQNNTRYDVTAAQVVQSEDLWDSNSGLSSVTECMVLCEYTDSGTPTIEVTADGTNWQTVNLNEQITLTNPGTVLKIRFTAGGTGYVESWAIFYDPDDQAIVEPVDFMTFKDRHPDEFAWNGNYLINGGFDIWQRGTSLSGPLSSPNNILADRWVCNDGSDGTANISQQSFTMGQTDVPGEPEFYLRHQMAVAATAGDPGIQQRIESVRTLAGRTVTFSFWARASSGAPTIVPRFKQFFGSSGSPSSNVFVYGSDITTISTSWQQFIVTVDIPSISGKTLGTDGDDYLEVGFTLPLSETWTLDIAQAKLEEGSKSTPFVARPMQQELALCMRYFEKSFSIDQAPGDNVEDGRRVNPATAYTTSNAQSQNSFKVPKRGVPEMKYYQPGVQAGSPGTWSFYDGSWIACNSTGNSHVSKAGFRCNLPTTALYTADGAFVVAGHWTADAEL